jgi:asparagine synthase (glutamine-hydrolysing)
VSVTGEIRLMARADLAATLGLTRGIDYDDRHLVAAAWRRWGRDCPSHLTGDFAFVIRDPHRRETFAARDPSGIQPFFYDFHGSQLIAASSLADLLAAHPDPPGADDDAIAKYLSRPFDCRGWTLLRRGIRTLEPGHSLFGSDGSWSLTRYCRLEDSPEIRFAKTSDYDDGLLALLRQVTREAAGSDRKTGVHLSGGLDSSSIAVLTPSAHAAYCWHAMSEERDAEVADQTMVRLVAEHAGLRLRPAVLTAEDVLRHLALDPMDCSVSPALLVEAPVQQAARQDGTEVLLSGWGGDECVTFSGCDRPGLLKRLFRKEPPESVRDRQIQALTGGHLGERMASWAWAGKRRGLEYRYPMLDIRLIRFALGMPPGIYRRGPLGRQFARRALAKILPAPVVRFTDKSDPTRSRANREATASALTRVLPRLSDAPPDRARHLDLPLLRRQTEVFIQTGEGPVGLILRSLGFLRVWTGD